MVFCYIVNTSSSNHLLIGRGGGKLLLAHFTCVTSLLLELHDGLSKGAGDWYLQVATLAHGHTSSPVGKFVVRYKDQMK